MSDTTTIALIADQAVSARRASMQPYDVVTDVKALEALRATETDEARQSVLDRAILERKRAMKGAAETVACRADMYDKSALPAGAALPGFVAFLDSQHAFDGPHRVGVLIFSYLFGGALWLLCRWLCFKYGSASKRRLAELGKVD